MKNRVSAVKQGEDAKTYLQPYRKTRNALILSEMMTLTEPHKLSAGLQLMEDFSLHTHSLTVRSESEGLNQPNQPQN